MEHIAQLEQIPDIDESAIHIWGLHVPSISNKLEKLRCILSKEEQDKAARFHHAADRDASIAARGALRVLLSNYINEKPERIAIHQSETGKPHLEDYAVNFNVSHSGEWVVLGFGRERKIGVDIEVIKRDTDVMKVAARYFTQEEATSLSEAEDVHDLFYRIWVRKEAYVKASGSALFRELSHVAVPLNDSEQNGWYFCRLEAGSRHAAAVVTDQPVEAMPCYDFGELQWDS